MVTTNECFNCYKEVESTAAYCSNCGQGLQSDSSPATKTDFDKNNIVIKQAGSKSSKNFFLRMTTLIVTIIPVIIGYIQFFSVTELPVIQGEIDLTDQSNKGRQLLFVNDIAQNVGRIVYFNNFQIIMDMDDQIHRESSGEDDSITYRFNFKELSSPEAKSTPNLSESEFVDNLMRYGSIPVDDRKQIELMNDMSMSGYNAHIKIHTKTNDRNEYSEFSPFVGEGTIDLLNGPFQIKDVSVSEAVMFELTAPSLDSAEKKRIACTKKQWHWAVKKCLCQFL